MVAVNCLRCNLEFLKNPSDAKKFCNRSCAASFNNTHTPKRSPEGKCVVCSSPVTNKSKYCSVACKSKAATERSRIISETSRSKGDHVVQWRQRTKLRAIEYKGGKCHSCGYNKCNSALEFHHLDPSQKDFSISSVSVSWDRIKLELDKCIMVCANCHREIHAGLTNTQTYDI